MQTPTLPPFNYTPQKYTGPGTDERPAPPQTSPQSRHFHLLQEADDASSKAKANTFSTKTAAAISTRSAASSRFRVGHCHPHVVAAANKQNETLQHSTTIYLHPNIVEFAEKLTSKMPGDLKVAYFVNSGSEANDLAVMMAQALHWQQRHDRAAQLLPRRQHVRHGPHVASHLEI